MHTTTIQKPLAVTYLRVSTKDQAERDGDPEGYSIPAQREANRRKAEAMGVEIVAEFTDRGESARSADRPELKRMLAFVREESVEYCIVHKVDRLARNRADDVEINLALTAAGVRLVSATENIDETPSGTLLHGIMSSIAEFYSRNLANEVVKGMTQKAKNGGTIGRAPLGYRNIHSIDDQGREARAAVVDETRAPLIRWAFEEYSRGETSLLRLAADLTAKGMTTRSTNKLSAKPISANTMQLILTNPYYRGDVTFRGVSYPGRHEPLVSATIWQKVQDVLASRRVGEKTRVHPHYLKSSVYCGSCQSRLIVDHATNRYGVTYEYFVCLGRHMKRTDCQQRAMPIDLIEHKITDYYRTVALPPELRQHLEATLTSELEAMTHEAAEAERRLLGQCRALEDKRRKLLEAHYAGAIPLDLLKQEQEQITAQLTTIKDKLALLNATTATLSANLQAALELAENCYEAYRRATPGQRRMINQAMFDRFYIHEDQDIDGQLAEPFKTLLDQTTLRYVASDQETKKEPQSHVLRDWGSKEPSLVAGTGFEPATSGL